MGSPPPIAMPDELELPQLMSAPAAEAVIDGRRMLYFGGTGYLGLQAHPEVIRAGCAALERYGVHSATTRTNFGSPSALAVERVAAELTGKEAAFYFASGYLGPQILLRGIATEFDAVFVDAQAHYCVHEAAEQCRLPVATFVHRSPLDLQAVLAAHLGGGARPLVLCDGVSPVTGAIAPLGEYCNVLRDYAGAGVLIDDAHGFGVLGEHGRGTWDHAGLDGPQINGDTLPRQTPAPSTSVRQFACVTLSKAIGGHGGLIAGSAALIRRLKEQSGHYRGASAPAAPVAGASAAGLRLALENSQLRDQLRRNVALLKHGLGRLGLPCDDSPMPIAGFSLGDQVNMERIQRELLAHEIAIGFLRSYTNLGPHGALRIAVFADHQPWMIEKLIAALQNIM
jgi:7-keto-8-aminopelargonate synthetase-like enzyme